ncbi:MAG: CotH kinase family protein [Vulcanimicrobiota bacterium]
MRGIWLRGEGRGRLIPWSHLVLGLTFPVALVLFLLLAVQHQEPIFEWLIYARRGHPVGYQVAREIFQERVSSSFYNVLVNPQTPTQGELSVLRLFSGDTTLEALTEDPDREPRPYLPAYLVENGHLKGCHIALRGFGHWHHAPEKPSLRVKVKRSEVGQGARFQDLSRPEGPLALGNWLPEQIGQKYDLLGQRTDHVALFFNHRYLGVYDRGYRAGDELAARLERPGGTFFKGDIVGPGGSVGAPGRSLWTGLQEWKVLGPDRPEIRRAFEHLLAELAQDRVPTQLDLEAMARWSALMAFFGSAHADAFHNQVFFYDPQRQLFEPVVWDVNGLGIQLPADAPLDLAPGPLEARLMREPAWRARRAELLFELLEDPAVDSTVEAELERLRPWLSADPGLSRLERTPVGVNRLRRYSTGELPRLEAETRWWLVTRRQVVRNYLEQATVARSKDRVWVDGNVPVRAGQRLLYPGLASQRVPYRFNLARLASEARAYQAEGPFFNAITGQPIDP